MLRRYRPATAVHSPRHPDCVSHKSHVPVFYLRRYSYFCDCSCSCSLRVPCNHIAMPRFLRRIFIENLFRKDARSADDLQRSRRVLKKSSTDRLGDYSFGRASMLDILRNEEDGRALRDGTSLASSDMHAAEPILASSQANHEEPTALLKTKSTRRRLSKKNGRPT